jgi:hypothetical protein
MRNKNTMFTTLVVDEHDTGAEGGENSTAEKAQRKTMADLHAGRYINTISVSPEGRANPSARILIEVVKPDPHTRTTHCILRYRLPRGDHDHTQILGYLNIDVNPLIANWEDRVKKVFLSNLKYPTPKKKKWLEIERKKDFWVEYQIRKYEKMKLITEHGINKPQLLDYSIIILNTIEGLRKLARLGKKVLSASLIQNRIKREFRQTGMNYTIVGKKIATEEAEGILDLFVFQAKIKKDIATAKLKIRKAKTKLESEELKENIKLYQGEMKELMEEIEFQMNELYEIKAIQEDFDRTISDQKSVNKKLLTKKDYELKKNKTAVPLSKKSYGISYGE